MNEQKARLSPGFKAKWVAALRGGHFAQGKSFLYNRDSGAFCCLGVAGKLCRIPLREMDLRGWSPVDNALSRRGLPSQSNAIGKLIKLNDAGKSFAQIADYIEANL